MKRSAMLLGAGILLLSSMVYAAVPQLINFQGILKDGSGNPVADGLYAVAFTIYDAASGGNILWADTLIVNTTDGLFAVLLGSDTPVLDSVFNGSSRYLGVKVGADPEMTPRQRLTSAAYSFRTAHFIPDYGFANTFIGRNAGNLTMTGFANTASGAYALQSNTTGPGNTASGFNALQSNTTGSENTANGAYALFGNTTGNLNTASGYGALFGNTTGDYNTASGDSALYSNTDGGANTASGTNALKSNTTGNFNTASGYQALRSNTFGGANTASGAYALYSNTTGNLNTASGYGALFSNDIGNYNTASGYWALFSNTTGYDNTASGYQALRNNTDGYQNTASGYNALFNNTGGNSNTAIGYSALSGNTTGFFNTAIGYGANVAISTMTNATAIGANAIVDASDKIRLGNGFVTVIEGQVAYTFTSDKNQKENFRPVDGNEVLRKIRGFELASWNYKGHDPKQFRHYGPMAQDFFAAFGDDGVGNIGTETTLNSGDVAGILMIAVQALEKEKELMKAENAGLKARMEQLEKQVKKMQAEKPQAEVR